MLHNGLKRKNRPILVSLFLIFLIGCTSSSFVEIDGKRIFVELADTPKEREEGLMFREELCDDCGMLFVFEEKGRHDFWMKNVVIPLDILFIDKDWLIVDIISAEPCTEDPCEHYLPSEDILYAVEVNKGFVAQHNISQGDYVTFSV